MHTKEFCVNVSSKDHEHDKLQRLFEICTNLLQVVNKQNSISNVPRFDI